MRNFFLLVCFVIVACKPDVKEEGHVKTVVEKVAKLKAEISTAYNCKPDDCVFISFWDYDGTILKGDCSEGLTEKQGQGFKGLVQLGIEAGYSNRYHKNQFDLFWSDYKSLEQKDHVKAYLLLLQIFAGTPVNKIEEMSRRQFNQVFSRHYFSSSISMMRKMQAMGIEVQVISASADFFVKGGAESLQLNPAAISGIRVAISDGIITEKPLLPITYAAGKTERLKEVLLLRKTQSKAKFVFALAGFGNSFSTDGHFLKYIVSQDYQGVRPVALMINGGVTPVDYKGLFWPVKQSQIIN